MLDADGNAVKATVSTQLRNDSTIRVAIYAEDFLDGKPYSFKISTDTLALVDIVAPADFTEDTALTLGNIHFSILDKEGNLSDKAVADATTKVLTFFVPDGKYLLKNIESGKYWGVGNNWGTQASLVKNAEFVTIIGNGDGTYKLESQVNNGGTAYYFEGDYMDNGNPKALSIKKFGTDDEPYYTISSDAGYYGYDGETTVLGKGLKVEDAAAQWEIISIEGADSAAYLATAKADAPVDATWLIKDANFGRNNRSQAAWVVSDDCTNKNLSGGNYNTYSNNCAESYHSVFTISQTLKAPKGVYKLAAQGFYRQDGEDNKNLPKFFIGDQEVTFPEKTGTENSMTDAGKSFSEGLYTIEPIIYEQAADGDLTIGTKLAENTAIWAIWDNFTLEYYGNASLAEVLLGDKVQQVADLVGEALEVLANDFLASENEATAALQEAIKNSRNLAATDAAYDAAIKELTEAIDAAKAVIAGNLGAIQAVKNAAIDALAPVGDGLFQYSQDAIDAAKAAVEAATSAEEVEAVPLPEPNAPEEGLGYAIGNTNAEEGVNLSVASAGVSLANNAIVFFTAVEGGYVISNNKGEYIATPTADKWTFNVSDNIEDAYVVSVNPVEGGYNIEGANGVFGTDAVTAGSSVWADKAATQSDKNVLWTIGTVPVDIEALTFADWSISDPHLGAFQYNTWSIEGNSGEDGAGMVVPFIEYWRGTGNNLDDVNISHAAIEGLEPGYYLVKIFVRAFNEGNATDYPTGVPFYANDAEVALEEEGTQALYNNQSTVLYAHLAVQALVGADGVLNVGFNTEGATTDWIAFKDLEIFYNGAADTAVAISDIENANNITVGTQKVLRNGRIVIIKNGREYNVSGALLK